MDTYKTLEEAREAKKEVATYIVEIEHVNNGRCFAGCKVNAEALRAAIAKGHAEIKAVYAGHLVHEIKIEHRCERCGTKVTDAAYNQMEKMNFGGKKVAVKAYYCDKCAELLNAIGKGEYTAMQERAATVAGYEPTTKIDY